MNKKPNKRLSIPQIKKHAFFKGINWDQVLLKKYEPEFKPQVTSTLDLQNIDSEFTN